MFDELIEAADAANARVGSAHRELLGLIAEVDRLEAWRDQGARDTAHWLSMRYGISAWKAHRWVGAARALQELSRLANALSDGVLGIDKAVELARFARPETESGLIAWAATVSCGAVRRRGDLELRAGHDELAELQDARFCSWWYFDEGRRFGLEAELPAAQGAIVARALERVASTIPTMPGEDGPLHADARRADALVALCSERIGADPDPDRATVIVHARADAPASGTGAEVQDGPVIPAQAVLRLLCNARVQTMAEDARGRVVGIGPLTRATPACMVRQVRYRDRECRFPGCGARRFTEAHHIRWWRHGGRTDLDNLALICSFHHRLVHEHGWSLRREGAELAWHRPDGTRYRSGPSPDRARDGPALVAVS